jgi:tRNA dimethylallyltransferase
VVQIGLRVDRAQLDRRIAERTARMWREGLVGEVAALERAGLREGRTASRALGYAQVLRFLAGDCTEDEARAQTVLATRRFARRQDAWFRRDPRVVWLAAGTEDTGRTARPGARRLRHVLGHRPRAAAQRLAVASQRR